MNMDGQIVPTEFSSSQVITVQGLRQMETTQKNMQNSYRIQYNKVGVFGQI